MSITSLAAWAGLLVSCLVASTACSSTTDSNSDSAGAANGGSAGANTGSAGTNSAGAATAGGSAGGASGAASSQAGSAGMAQAGAPAGGTSNGGTAGGDAGANTGGGASGSAGNSAGGPNAGSGGGTITGNFTLTSPGWTAMAGCSADNKSACPIFPKENIGTSLGGSNQSPQLDWTAGPSGTQSYAIVLQDLTNITAGKPFVHWVMWNIPGTTRMLPAGLETSAMPSVPPGSSQKSFSGNGYQGSGKCGNVYEFVLYALPMAMFTPSGTVTQTSVRDALAASNAPTATLRARSGAPGCAE
ncbi:MAG TPA: hypothetical protein VER12_01085 [Polyangiaceae bacterium]|nr:hypothetical protein [Polyangiaceae bacterium]